jgi:hypothetical protein
MHEEVRAMSEDSRLTQAKIRRAQQGAQPHPTRSADARIPPGQKRVEDFPVLDLGVLPSLAAEQWRVRVYGLVGHEVNLDLPGLLALPQVKSVSDFHCVTQWSRLDLDWEGVRAAALLDLARPLPDARYVTLHGADGYTTNLPLATLSEDDVLIAHRVLGQPLLWLEEREVADRHRAARARPPRLLGGARLSQRGRPVAGAALCFGCLNMGCNRMHCNRKGAETQSSRKEKPKDVL